MANQEEEYSKLGISLEEKDKVVAEVMRYVLFKTHQSSGCPIKREELTQLITKNYHQRSLPTLIINEAIEKMSNVFGYKMKELQRCRASSNRQGRASQQSAVDAKSYIILSQLSPDIYSKFVEDKETSHMTGYTFVVIGIVLLAGGKMSEEDLWRQLCKLGINGDDISHPLFGNTKQALDMLVQQRYLQKEKVSGPEGNVMTYRLADRSLDESVNQKLKEFISQIVGEETVMENEEND